MSSKLEGIKKEEKTKAFILDKQSEGGELPEIGGLRSEVGNTEEPMSGRAEGRSLRWDEGRELQKRRLKT